MIIFKSQIICIIMEISFASDLLAGQICFSLHYHLITRSRGFAGTVIGYVFSVRKGDSSLTYLVWMHI